MEQRPTPKTPVPPTSRLAWTAFVLSLILCCPLTSLAGAICGIIAMRRIQLARGRLGGRWLAVTAVLLGVASSVVQYGAAEMFASWFETTTRTVAAEQVRTVLDATLAGRPDDAAALFEASTRPTPDAVSDFGETLQERYGAVQRVSVMHLDGPRGGQLSVTVALAITFEHQEVAASAELTMRFIGGFRLTGGLHRLVIEDRERGRLELPPPAASSGPSP